MPVFNLFSKRKRAAEKQGGVEVFKYDEMPTPFRIQVLHILADAIGPYHVHTGIEMSHVKNNNDAWDFLANTLCREKGLARLSNRRDQQEAFQAYFCECDEVDDVLDAIELSFGIIENSLSRLDSYQKNLRGITQRHDDAIEELNVRFLESGLGYRFESGQIIKVTSEYIHSEIVKPTLVLISDRRFAGSQSEFLTAHEHFREGRHKEAVTLALNSFESAIKTICTIKKWDVPKGARASDLIKILKLNKYFPDYLDASFDQLLATLSSGLPKVRNEEGGHGQGSVVREVPSNVSAYALHLAAAKIVFLVSSLKK